MKLGEKFNIFIDANPYPYTKFYSYHDDNKFIRTYNKLKEMVIEGVLSIQAGDNPRILATKLLTYLDPIARKAIEADVLKD